MKVTNTRESDFQPYTLSITVETEDEHAALLALSGLNVSVADFVRGARPGAGVETPLRTMLGHIYSQL